MNGFVEGVRECGSESGRIGCQIMGLLTGKKKQDQSSTDSRASKSSSASVFASKLFANLAPNAVFRKVEPLVTLTKSLTNEMNAC